MVAARTVDFIKCAAPGLGVGDMRVVIGIFCLLGLLCAVPASAQNVILDAPGFLLNNKKKSQLPPPRAAPMMWPRLDPGAVFCRTEDDLSRHASNMTARVSGGDTEAADCRAIAQPTGIEILNREGPGRTQVKLGAPSNEVGWTDAWLPSRAPAR